MHPEPRLRRIDGDDRGQPVAGGVGDLHAAPPLPGRARHGERVLPADGRGLAADESVPPQDALVAAAEQEQARGATSTRGAEALDRQFVDRLGRQQPAVGTALMPADHLPRRARPLDQIGVAVAIEIDELPVEAAAAFPGREPARAATRLERELLDALLVAHEQFVAAVGQVADEEDTTAADRLAGKQVPLARLPPRGLGVGRQVGRLRVDRDAVGRHREHEQLGPPVAVDVMGHHVDGRLVDRHLAMRPVGRQR